MVIDAITVVLALGAAPAWFGWGAGSALLLGGLLAPAWLVCTRA